MVPHPLSALSRTLRRGDQTKIVLPPVIGHRGAAGYAPENTAAGFRKAAALGCCWVEFDVRLTSDNQPVLLHDNRLERTTDGRGKVNARSFAAIRRHDAGSWFHPSFAGERVPKLAEALALLVELGLGGNIELKAARGRAAETGALVSSLLASNWPDDPARLLISSFQPVALAAARDHAPRVPRGILFRRIPKNWFRIAAKLGCATIHADQQRLSAAVVSDIRQAGYPLLAYTVNDRARAQTLFDWGVTSVFSDVPDRLQGVAAGGGSCPVMVANRASAAAPRQEAIW
ncbi:MAG: glycerophosphodiester phosphodiesterase [Alphaproteobacteria bacterium]|nr:glycerophosphodiester phosphodiesterase [Alphaproteobacteria bacterium]